MASENLKTVGAVIGWLLTAAFGSGWIWQYQTAKIEREKWDVQKIPEIRAIREQTTEKLIAVAKIVATGQACAGGEAAVEVRALVDDLKTFERQLAVLEGRAPRSDLYQEILRPCPPTGLTVR
jgi:hypothetical protein